jgi:hypothetical protein
MKLLFLTGANGPDYLCDMLMHGLRGLLGGDAVDVKKLWYLYADSFGPGKKSLTHLPGGGFSLYGLLPDIPVDRDDISSKLTNHYFDLVVFGSIQRPTRHSDEVWQNYSRRDVIMLDGEDEPRLRNCLNQGIYFKRELEYRIPGVYPIQFCMPEEKLKPFPRIKKKMLAICDPRNPETYVFEDEASFYADYQESHFGITMKKGGWDCLRHYEILANGCAPLFLNLQACPELTMFRYPKKQNLSLLGLLDERGPEYFLQGAGRLRYQELTHSMCRVLADEMTTKAMARYVLDVWTRVRQGGS